MNLLDDLKKKAFALLKENRLVEAKTAYYEAYQEAPEDVEILVCLGIACAREADFQNAEKWLEKAVAISPDNPDIHVRMGNIMRLQGKYSQAKTHYQVAISEQPHSFEAHFYLASIYMYERQLEDAEYHFLYASQLRPSHPDCHANLGLIYELSHKLDDARRAANTALGQKQEHVGALLVLGKLEKREGKFVQAEKLFRKILALTTDESIIATTEVELGHVLDKQGEYDRAFEAFSSGKSAWARIAENTSFDRQEYQKRIECNKKWFVESNVKHPLQMNGKYEQRRAPVFLVGFPRSGTTLTEQILGMHQNIISTNEKPYIQNLINDIPALLDTDEPFPENIIKASTNDIAKLRDTYWGQVEQEIEALDDRTVLVDKLPLNIVDLGFIFKLFPDAHILIALRDPRDVCISCFMQGFQLNPAMVNFLSIGATTAFYSQVMGLWLNYRKVLPIKWYEYRYEDLIENFEETTRGIFGFLGLDCPASANNYHASARMRYINTPSYQDVTMPIYKKSVARWENYRAFIDPHMETLEPYIREFGYQTRSNKL